MTNVLSTGGCNFREVAKQLKKYPAMMNKLKSSLTYPLKNKIMKNLFPLLFVLIALPSYSQELQQDTETNKVYFEDVVTVEGAPAETLYSQARQWFAIAFKSANNVLQMDDPTSGILIGKGYTTINVMGSLGSGTVEMGMYFQISVQVRDGRFKYNITDITYQNPGTVAVACELLITGDRYYKRNGEPRPVNKSYRESTIAEVNSIAASLTSRMRSQNKAADNW
jgi:hypothetical protein